MVGLISQSPEAVTCPECRTTDDWGSALVVGDDEESVPCGLAWDGVPCGEAAEVFASDGTGMCRWHATRTRDSELVVHARTVLTRWLEPTGCDGQNCHCGVDTLVALLEDLSAEPAFVRMDPATKVDPEQRDAWLAQVNGLLVTMRKEEPPAPEPEVSFGGYARMSVSESTLRGFTNPGDLARSTFVKLDTEEPPAAPAYMEVGARVAERESWFAKVNEGMDRLRGVSLGKALSTPGTHVLQDDGTYQPIGGDWKDVEAVAAASRPVGGTGAHEQTRKAVTPFAVEVLRHHDGRLSWVVRRPEGAIEAWCNVLPFGRSFGGIEIHRHAGKGHADHAHCTILGGPCQHDGSSLAYVERIEPLLKTDGSTSVEGLAEIAAVLTRWADNHLGVVPAGPAVPRE